MSRSKEEKSTKKGRLAYVQKRINSISKRIDEFYTRLDGSSSITSPERKQHYNELKVVALYKISMSRKEKNSKTGRSKEQT